jgi:uncharacterized protein YjbI with pentapeptide repeats
MLNAAQAVEANFSQANLFGAQLIDKRGLNRGDFHPKLSDE